MSEPVEIVPGLLRWSAPHPDWKQDASQGGPDDWEEMVGSVLYEAGETVVLIDPLLPRDEREREQFLARLDERVGTRPVSILTTIRWHIRDRRELAERYRGNMTRAWNAVPDGVHPKALKGAGEIMYWLPGVATLVPGDRLLGDSGSRLRVCPESWLSRVSLDRRGLARLMRPLLELPIERVLVSHGQPVLGDGRAELDRAIALAGGRAHAHPA